MAQATITVTKGRLHSDIRMHVSLKDNGVAVDWTGLSSIRAMLYSVEQQAMAGRCSQIAINSEDPTDLICDYSAASPQFEGLNRIVIRCVYEGRTKTYDAVAVFLVESTDELSGEEVVVDDPEVDVEIEVTEVSTSLLDEAIQAAFDAAELAEDAAAAAEAAADKAPYIGENGNWFLWDNETQQYVDSGKPSQGDPGFTFEQTTDPSDPDYQDEYQRVLGVLYQAIEDAGDATGRTEDAITGAQEAATAASSAAGVAAQAAESAQAQADAAGAAAQNANQKAANADNAAGAAQSAAAAASSAAGAVSGAAEAAREAASAASSAADNANGKASLANTKAGYAAEQGDYAKSQGDYAKGQIDGAKGAFNSLNERFEATENAAITLDETTDPADAEYQDEYQRVLGVLYQAIEDSKQIQDRSEESADAAVAAAGTAQGAAGAASMAATGANDAAAEARNAASAANTAMNSAKGNYGSLNERIQALEAGKQDKIDDLAAIRENASAGAAAYQKPSGGIPADDLTTSIQETLTFAGSAITFEASDDPASILE